MTSLLCLLVTMSLSGTLLAGAVLLLTPLLKNHPALRYFLWLATVLRLVLPFAAEPNLMARLTPYLNTPAGQTAVVDPLPAPDGETHAPTEPAGSDALAASAGSAAPAGSDAPAAPADSDAPASLPSSIPEEIYAATRRLAGFGAARVPAFLWLFGMCATLVPHVLGVLRLRKTLRQSARPASADEQAALQLLCPGRRPPLLQRCPAVETPLTLGVLRPAIVLPAGQAYSPAELHYILLHELAHIRRLDAAFKWLTLLATSMHWFNPFIWPMQRIIEQTCEQACDAAVVCRLDKAARLAYCETLLRAASTRPRSSLPAPALSKDAKALNARMNAVLSYREPARFHKIGAALLVSLAVLAGWTLGCTNGLRLPASPEDETQSAILDVCTQWMNALPSQDAQAREALMTGQMRGLTPGSSTFSWLRHGHALRSHTVTPGSVRTNENGRRWTTAYINACLEGPDRLLYPAAGQLELQETEEGWRVHNVTWAGYLEPISMEDLNWMSERYFTNFPPEYTGDDLLRMEAEQSGLYGLSPADAAVAALHLSNGSVQPAPGRGDVWYHWADGDILIHMEQAEGHEIWLPTGVDLQYLDGFTFQQASNLILSGIPDGWSTEDRLPKNGYFYCAVLDPDGAERCTLAVDYVTGEILWADGRTLRPYHESPLRELLLAQDLWEGEFHPYGQEEQRTVLHRIGEQDFSWFRPDGSSGNGTFSGAQGWSDDGKYLFLWCSGGSSLKIYQRGTDGRLLLDAVEQLPSDFGVRNRER